MPHLATDMDTFGHIDNFIAEIDRAESLEAIKAALRKQVDRLGFEIFAYQLLWPPSGPWFPLYVTTYPDGWAKRYYDQGHRGHDLVARHAAVASRPFLWPEIPNIHRMTDRQRLVFNEFAEFGKRTGATIPIRGPALAKAQFTVASLCISDEEVTGLFFSRRHELHLIATYVHERILDIAFKNSAFPRFTLTPRELEIMTYTAEGKSAWDISKLLRISEHTVSEYIEKVCRKLNVYNKVHATAICIVNGVIKPAL